MMEKPLLILDLDETLIHGLKEPLEIDFDMLLGPYFIYFRPFAVDFLRSQSDRYQLGFWSSATISYVGPICRQLMKGNPDPCLSGTGSAVRNDLTISSRRPTTLRICARLSATA